MTQWDFQNKGKSGWTGKSSFVLKVPLRHLRPSVIYSVPCDWILQMAYCIRHGRLKHVKHKIRRTVIALPGGDHALFTRVFIIGHTRQ